MLFWRKLVMFGPREVLLSSDQPVVKQFRNGRPSVRSACPRRRATRKWPRSRRLSRLGRTTGVGEIHGVPPQIQPTPGLPRQKAVKRHRARVHEIMHTLPESALEAIRADLEGTSKYRGRDVA